MGLGRSSLEMGTPGHIPRRWDTARTEDEESGEETVVRERQDEASGAARACSSLPELLLCLWSHFSIPP